MMRHTTAFGASLRAARGLAPDFQRRKGIGGPWHQIAESFLDQCLDILAVDVRVTACNVVLLADRQDLVDGRSHCRVVVLPGIAEILRQVALTDDYHTDTGYLLKHVRQVFDRSRLLA